jgi:hypothetical protein
MLGCGACALPSFLKTLAPLGKREFAVGNIEALSGRRIRGAVQHGVASASVGVAMGGGAEAAAAAQLPLIGTSERSAFRDARVLGGLDGEGLID